MRSISYLLLLCLLSVNGWAQQETELGRYIIRRTIPSQDTIFIKVAKDTAVLRAGWVLTETKADRTVQRILAADTAVIVKKDSAIRVINNWKIGEVKHSDDAPGKLILNPYFFSNPADSLLNNQWYIKIPENSYVRLLRKYIKWNAITIPFAIRPSLNDTIGSKITTDLKIGASVSYNVNWETFKNRRIAAKKSVHGISTGIGFGFSKVTLNAASTSLATKPLTREEDGLAFFIAPGIGFNIKGFQINFSYGWDLPITHNVHDWNYAGLGYWGIGLGVGLDVFGKL